MLEALGRSRVSLAAEAARNTSDSSSAICPAPDSNRTVLDQIKETRLKDTDDAGMNAW